MVRSHKDKRWDQMTDTIAKMKNSMKNNDWNAISTDYDTLHKLLDKAKNIVAKEGMPVHNQHKKFGNLVVTYQVDFPKKLTEKQKGEVKKLFAGTF